jgi:hypothetical protein
VRLIEEKTIYGVYGDWVVWASLLLGGLSLGMTVVARRHDGTMARRHDGTTVG